MNNSDDIAEIMEQAHNCLDAGNLGEARSLFSRATELDADNGEAWLMLGAVHGESGAVDDALGCVRTAVERKPDYAEAHLTMTHLLHAKGETESALASARTAVELDPDYGEAWLALAGLAGQLQQFEQAQEAGQKAVALAPTSVEAHVNLAGALHQLGQLTEAETACRRALQLQPGHAEANATLGNLLLAQKRYDEATASLSQALQLDPGLREAHANLGIAYMEMGRRSEAESSFRQALQLAPEFAPSHVNLGNIYLETGRHEEAASSFQHAMQLDPDLVEACIGLGRVCVERNDLSQASGHFRKALELRPGYLPAQINLGFVQELMGQFDDALASYTQIQENHPETVDAIAAQASVYERKGDFEKGNELIQGLLDGGHNSVLTATAFARLCKHTGKCPEAINYIEKLLRATGLSEHQVVELEFSLGALCDQAGEFDRAFEHFRKGNTGKKAQYDPQGYTRYVDSLISVYTPELLKSMPHAASNSDRPVFIVGMPRSGTSLVEQILATHPAVFGGGELPDLLRITSEMQAKLGLASPYPGCLDQLDQQAVDGLAKEYLDSVGRLADDAGRITDKLPHNFHHLGLIRALFPRARIIHCVRDPLDTCLSCYFQDFSGYQPYAYDLADLGSHYRQYERLMRHWKDVGIPMLEVRYEDLVADQEKMSKELVEYCGLEWDERCLRFFATDRATQTASYDQVRQPIYTTSIERWKLYDRHLGPLRAVLG